MDIDPNLLCRVCGLLQKNPPWGESGRKASHAICPCCGVEFGYEDSTLPSIKTYRKAWIKGGHEWYLPEQKPKNWNPLHQISRLRDTPFA